MYPVLPTLPLTGPAAVTTSIIGVGIVLAGIVLVRLSMVKRNRPAR
jgi:LPXTG-motif cell wall-anchored protein